MNIKSHQKEKGSVVKVEIEITTEELNLERERALNHIKEHVEIKGFRKGHVPEKELIKHVGEFTILEESAELAIETQYPKVIEELKLNPVGNPKVVITKIAPQSPLELTLEIPVFPEFTLPEYKKDLKKINDKEETVEVTEKEISDVVEEIKKIQNKDKETDEELSDEFIKTLGKFESVSDFKEKIKQNLLHEKETKEKQKKRISLLQTIREKTEIEIPIVFIENELEKMVSEFSFELKKVGSDFENYKKQIGKTSEEIKEEWKTKATERVTDELIINKIVAEEKIKPKEEDVTHELEHMKEHYPDIEEKRLRFFVEDMLTKEEVFKFLEKIK